MSLDRHLEVGQRRKAAVSGQENPLSRPGSRTRTETPAQRVARKPDLDACPSGWDPDVWHLALCFEQGAEKWGITLAAGRPVIYAKLERRIALSKIRDATDRQRTDSNGVVRTWRDLVEAMITRFWTRPKDAEAFNLMLWDANALEDFTSLETFRKMGREVREKAANQRALAKIEAKARKGEAE